MDHSLHSYLKRLPTQALERFLEDAAYEQQTQQQTKILIGILEILHERYQNRPNSLADIFIQCVKP